MALRSEIQVRRLGQGESAYSQSRNGLGVYADQQTCFQQLETGMCLVRLEARVRVLSMQCSGAIGKG